MKNILSTYHFNREDIDPEDCEVLTEFMRHSWSFQNCYKVRHKSSNKIYVMKTNVFDGYITTVGMPPPKHVISEFKKRIKRLKQNQFTSIYFIPYFSLCLRQETQKSGKINDYIIYSFKPYIHGACLQSIFSSSKGIIKTFTFHLLAKVAHRILIILREIHANDQSHGNLVPSNIIIEPDGGIKVIDCYVPLISQGINPDYDPPRMGSWLPPEIIMQPSTTQPKPAWDIYQLGLTMADCLVGGLDIMPYTIIEPSKTKFFNFIKKFIKEKSSSNEASTLFIDMLEKMLQAKPEDRPSAKQLLLHPFIKRYKLNYLTKSELNLHPNIPNAYKLNPSLRQICVDFIINNKISYSHKDLPEDISQLLPQPGAKYD